MITKHMYTIHCKKLAEKQMDFLDNRLNKWILPNYTFFLQKKNAYISPNLKKKYGYRIKLFFLLEYRKH